MRDASERSERAGAGRVLVVDFDGTITERDTLELLVHEFGDPDVFREADAELGRTLTLHDVIAREYATLSAPRDRVVSWALGHVRFRPGFRELFALARKRGWRLVIVSSGLEELIRPLLAREGVEDPELVCNTLAAGPGWRVEFRDENACEVCGEACKRAAVAALAANEVVYVGDGFSDGCAAVAADRVFARRRLATYLEERGRDYEPFDDFFDVIRALEL